jgi:ribokinase
MCALGSSKLLFPRLRRVPYATFPVEVRDTTATGDTFNAALALALSENQPMERALLFANAAAAISVTRVGAQASAPTRAGVDRFVA